MAKAVQKITLSRSRDIPFNKLVLSQSNVRRVKAGVSIEQLAESIAHRTLLQSLNVRAVLDGDGNETGMFEVPAGGRRYRALELLVKQKRLAKTQPVPCVVREGGIAEDDSLAENDERVGLHPLDQFRAFHTLRNLGMSEDDIAARHFVTPTIVKQRLRLASVSPNLLDVYAEDSMALEQLMAFTVTGDHARQEQVWESVSKSGYDEPYQIRRMLTESTVRASDKRAQFVGVAAYEAGGGAVLRDLFERDDGGWLQDVPLLDRLVTEKLKAEAEAIAAEGWKWIEVAVGFPYGYDDGLRQLQGTPADITAEEQATIDALQAEQAKLEAEYQDADELPDEIDARLGEIEKALRAFDNRPHIYDPAEVTRAGAFVSIDSDGTLLVERGFVRPKDEAPVDGVDDESNGETSGANGADSGAPSASRTVITVGGSQPEAEDEEDDGIKPLPDRLIMELTWHRARDQIAADRRDLATRTLVEQQFRRWSQMQGRARRPLLLRNPDLANGVDLAKRWKEELPTELVQFISESSSAAKAIARRRWAVAGAVMLCLAALAVLSAGALYIAEVQRNDALIVQSQFLARDSTNATLSGDASLGLNLALAALPQDVKSPDRPFVRDAERALAYASANNRELRLFVEHGGGPFPLVALSDNGIAAPAVLFSAFSPDGKLILTTSTDYTASLWDRLTGQEVHTLKGHSGAITSAAFSPDGQRVVTVAMDNTARLWDVQSGKLLSTTKSNSKNYGFNHVAYSPNGKLIAFATSSGSAAVRNLETGSISGVGGPSAHSYVGSVFTRQHADCNGIVR